MTAVCGPQAGTDPADFHTAYRALVAHVEDQLSQPGASNGDIAMFKELRRRGVAAMSFYDIVLDFLLLDAFDELEVGRMGRPGSLAASSCSRACPSPEPALRPHCHPRPKVHPQICQAQGALPT